MKQKRKKFKKGSLINPTYQFAAAFGLLIISIIASRGGTMKPWEVSLFNFLYDSPSFLRPVFLAITQLGSMYLLWILLFVYLLRRRYHILLRLLMTGTSAYLVSGFVKDIWGRARPDELLIGIINLDYARGPGFPSGHVALATALAFTIGHYLPRKYQWMVPVWIIAVSISRVYLGVHAPLDIIGGFAIGWTSYALFRHVRLYDIGQPRKPAIESSTKQTTLSKKCKV